MSDGRDMRSVHALRVTGVIGVLALQSVPALAQDRSLLSDVAWAYTQFIDYRAEVDTKIRDLASDEPATRRRFVLAASRPKMWYVHELVLAPVRDEVRLGSDGETVWGFAPHSKKYVVHARAFERTHEWAAVRDFHSRYFLRFEVLDRIQAETEFLGYRARLDGRKKVRCAILRLAPRNEDWTEEIWIDPQRRIVLRSVVRKKSLHGLVLTETEWRNLDVNVTVDQSLFKFVAPDRGVRTSAIAIP